MKVKLLALSLLGGFALNVSAQTEQTNKPGSDLVFEKSSSTGWFVTLQGGADFMAFKKNNVVPFTKRIEIMPSLSIGKFINPYFATRLQVNAGKINTHDCPQATGLSTNTQNNKFIGAHYDFMFDLVNYFATYKADRVFHVMPFLGAGYEYKFDSDINSVFPNVHSLTANAGLQLSATVAKYVDIVLEGMATYNNLPINKPYPQYYYNGVRVSTTAGLRIKLGNPVFNVVTPMDYALVNDLNDKISSLRAENAELAKRPERCPECPEVSTESKSSMLTQKTVLFNYGKSEVSEDQMIHLFDAAKVVTEGNGEIVVTGYVSKNEKRLSNLAQKRAQAVADVLSSRFNVPSDKITVEWKEVGDQAYQDNASAWNRAVVINAR